MALDYTAYLVTKGNIALISPVHTLKTAKSLVNYWKKTAPESFYAKKVPKRFKEQVETYWKEYEMAHPKKEMDPNELPW